MLKYFYLFFRYFDMLKAIFTILTSAKNEEKGIVIE